jgi:hypothetical protein
MRLLVVASEKRERLMSERIQNVRVEHLETDEVRSYVGCQQKRVRPEMDEPYLKGDQYTFIALGDGRSTDQFHRANRLTRLTYAYSKKSDHLHAALALHSRITTSAACIAR